MKKKGNIIFLTLDFLPYQKQKKRDKIKIYDFYSKNNISNQKRSAEKLAFFFRQKTRKIGKNAEMH